MSRVAVKREQVPDRLAARVADPRTGATISRWGEDEQSAENVLDDLKLSGELNGGAKEAATALARDPLFSYSDLYPFLDVEFYGPGVNTIWEGRTDKAPESNGDDTSVKPAIVGHKAALEDNKALIGPGFINKDQSAWTGPSIERRLALRNANVPNQGDPQSVWDVSSAALRFEVQGAWVSPLTPVCEGWFDAGSGIRIARLIANWINGWNDANFILRPSLTDSPVGGEPVEGPGDLYTAATGSIDYSPATPRRYAFIHWLYFATPAGGDGAQYPVDVTNLTVLSDLAASLALQGEWPEVGFTAKQMLALAVPEYTYLEVNEEEMEDDEFVIPQAWFSEPGSMLQVVEELTKYGLLDWFVRGKKFNLRFPGTYGQKWQAYAGPSNLQEQGLDASRLWRSIVVRYTDVDGSTRTVGPPGSGASAEDAGLEITDPDHPAVKMGLTRQDILDLNEIGTQAQAIATGERWLEQANLLSRSGSCVASYYLLDDRGVERPVSQIREGDLIRFPDAHDTSYRKIVSYEYTHSTRSNYLTLDAPKDSIPALLARFNAKISALNI